ncbi:hypothetical protein ACFV42_23670 [Streptomyces solisilvae]|uniref:hypothetical protein n=1 Tax=Streptomyces malaysiensis TaxID=92644 RepID=UPI00367A24ED
MLNIIMLAFVIGMAYLALRQVRRYPSSRDRFAVAFLPAHRDRRHGLRNAALNLDRVRKAHDQEIRKAKERWAKTEGDLCAATGRLRAQHTPAKETIFGNLALDPANSVLRWTDLEGSTTSLPLSGLRARLETDDPSNWIIVVHDHLNDQYSAFYSRADHPSSEKVRDFTDQINRTAAGHGRSQQQHADEKSQLDARHKAAKAAYEREIAALNDKHRNDPELHDAQTRWDDENKKWAARNDRWPAHW